MVTDFVEPMETLGQRLNRHAKWLMSAHTPAFGWLRPMQELLDHLASLPGPAAGRFDRIEAGGSLVDFHDRIMPALRFFDDRGQTSTGRQIVGTDGETTTGRHLPSDVLAQVRRVIGRDAAAMRVHDDRTADMVARAHQADAVTFGRDVYFRQGRFRPRDPLGFGLVAHEATHVTELLAPGAAWRRLTRSGQHDEERVAEANERRASMDSRAHSAPPPAPPQRFGQPPTDVVGFVAVTPQQGQPVESSPSEVAAPPALQPMLAAEDRAADAAVPLDLEALQRSLLEDIKRQLRTEFERGA